MAKHTAKAMRSGKAQTPRSGHTKAAVNLTRGRKVNGTSKHTTTAMGRTRPMKFSPVPREITEANKRRNFSRIPKTKG